MSTSTQAEVYAPESLLSNIEVRAHGIYDQGLLGLAPREVSIDIKPLKLHFKGGPIVAFNWPSAVRPKEEALAIFVPKDAVGMCLRTHEAQIGGGFNTNVYDLHIAASGLATYTQELVRSRQKPEYIAFEEHKIPFDIARLFMKYTNGLIVWNL